MTGVARLDRADRHSLVSAALLTSAALLALPPLLSNYWLSVCTGVAYMSIVALGLGLLAGRVGLVSLGQIAVLALGAWIGAKLAFSTGLPFPLLLIATGLITMLLGTLVGLPAVRLGGLHLALITLMLAGAITVLLGATNFPNGGGGFLGYTDGVSGSVRRPAIATSDPAYFRYCVVVALVMFALALVHVRGKPGRAWAAIRHSEAAAIAAGVNVTLYKLWAFALASFVTGVAGALLAAAVGTLYPIQFPTSESIVLLAAVLMGGIYTLWGAIVAGTLLELVPALLDAWGLPPDLLTVIFGLGVLQVLTMAPAGIATQLPRDLRRLGGRLTGLLRHDRLNRKGTAPS